jgi:hypothetical protein
MGEQVVQRWGYVSGVVNRHFVEDEPRKASFERAERLNAARIAIDQGFVPVPGAAVTVAWEPLPEVELEMLSRVARDLDGRVSEQDFLEATEEELAAEEERRRANLRGCKVMRVSFDVYTDAEEPGLRSFDRETFDALAVKGAEVLHDKDHNVLLCGGALRRHKFAPRDAAWMRDGAIQSARCQDCDQRVTREELLNRQFREDQYGTCVTCGDALEPGPTGGRLDVGCPTCKAAGRE